MTRSDTLAAARDGSFDLLVVGGGVTGAGIARDAALRGLRVCLVERSDLASGTSSASSKLIHGGLRYLEQYEFGLVREGTLERALLMDNAPHLAQPLPFLFPIYEGARAGPLMVRAGMWLYDLLSSFRSYERHRWLGRREVRKAEPGLLPRGLRASAHYYDCLTDDGRLTLETALDAREHGAVVVTYAEVVGLVEDRGGKTVGVQVRDRLAALLAGDEAEAAQPFEVRAKVTAVAAGPWSDDLLGARVGRTLLRPTKGSHIVLDAERLHVNHAVCLISPDDGRVMFAIPWGRRTIVGTTDTDVDDVPDRIEASLADVDYLLAATNHFFPRAHLTRADVISTWSGLRPLMAEPETAGAAASAVSREHEIVNIDPGLLAIAGGKLTTYRLMAEQVVDRALRKLGTLQPEPSRTRELQLLGARGPRPLLSRRVREPARRRPTPEAASGPQRVEDLAQRLAREHALEPEIAEHLAQAYGLRADEVLAAGQDAGVRPGRIDPDLPFLFDEVVFAVRAELAQRLDDVLRRRTLIFLQSRDQGLSVCEEVAELMGRELGWDAARVEQEVEHYRGRVAASRAWRAQAEAATGPAPAALGS